MGKKKKKNKPLISVNRQNDDSIPLREILEEARAEKIRKQEESRRRSRRSFTEAEIIAFASGVEFKKNTPERETQIREGIQNSRPILTKVEKRVSPPKRIERPPYELWYEKVSAEQKEEKEEPQIEEVVVLRREEEIEPKVKDATELQKEENVEPQNIEAKQAPPQANEIDLDLIYSVFKNVSTSYKYFWFLSLLSIIKRKERVNILLSEMSAEMMALAWPYIYEYGLDLGKEDSLKKISASLIRQTPLIEKATENTVRSYINVHYSLAKKIISPLLENVPYRFLSPWIKFVSKEDVIQKSNDISFACPYAFVDDNIVFDEDWYDYLHDNLDKLEKFAKSSLLEYLKKHNSEMALLKYKMKNPTN